MYTRKNTIKSYVGNDRICISESIYSNVISVHSILFSEKSKRKVMEQAKLSQATLSKLTSSDFKIPTYDRSKIKVGIFHFGVGNFHRAHQALILDSLFERGLGTDYGICGVGVMPQDAKMRDVLKEQDYLYTCVEKASNGVFNYHVIGSIVDFMFAPDDVNALIERLCTSEAKIISMTITQGGYNINPHTGDFDLLEPHVQEDLKNPTKPKTVFGIVVEALRRRKERKLKGFTILSCDNLQENGKMARKSFYGYAKAVDPELAEWIIKNVTFPNCMVDRITPVTTDDDKKQIEEKLRVIDGWPVVCEDFLCWVIEDNFVDRKRPPLEKHEAVHIVKDVVPYEFMKLRLLNVGHQAITYFGLLLDYKYVYEVARNDLITGFFRCYMDSEATQTLLPVPGIDLEKFKDKIIERYQNPNILDTLKRLSSNGSERIAKFVTPVIEDRLKNGQSIWLSTAIVASYAYFLNGISDSGKFIEVIDHSRDELMILSKNLQNDATWIKNESELFGDVVFNPKFIIVFKEIYNRIATNGSEDTLKWLISLK